MFEINERRKRETRSKRETRLKCMGSRKNMDKTNNKCTNRLNKYKKSLTLQREMYMGRKLTPTPLYSTQAEMGSLF